MTQKSKGKNKEKKVKLNKQTIKDLDGSGEKIRGGVKPVIGTGPVSNTCKTACHHC